MRDWLLLVGLTLGAVGLWFGWHVVGAVREVWRGGRRLSWDKRADWERSMHGLGGDE